MQYAKCRLYSIGPSQLYKKSSTAFFSHVPNTNKRSIKVCRPEILNMRIIGLYGVGGYWGSGDGAPSARLFLQFFNKTEAFKAYLDLNFFTLRHI